MRNNKKISFLNTQTGGKELFVPATQQVSFYVCGVTPYDYAHMGHARCYVSFDIIQRVLVLFGYAVTYIRNVTDVDDKIVRKAELVGGDPLALAAQYTEAFNDDMDRLNVVRPAHEPKVSDHIPEIIDFIQQLIASGHAYVVGGDVYFSLDAQESYGELSGRKNEDLFAGARVEVAQGKKNPGDFVLWKGNVVGSLWDSSWGPGRPGWHIECSTFVKKYAGDTVTIHGGGIDLLFPHHENECAQSRALTGEPLAQYWLHNAHVTLNAEKMSKSLGNVFSIRDVLAQFDPMVVRFYLIQHHYRTPLDISMEHIASAARAYNKLVRAFNPTAIEPNLKECMGLPDLWSKMSEQNAIIGGIDAALADDVNVPKALGMIFANLDRLSADTEATGVMRTLLQQVLGLDLLPVVEKVVMTSEIEQLIAQREKARANKEWARADQLRSELADLGYQVVDKK